MEKHMIFDYKYIKALNKTEASIYNYIIHNMGKVVDMNVRDLQKKPMSLPQPLSALQGKWDVRYSMR